MAKGKQESKGPKTPTPKRVKAERGPTKTSQERFAEKFADKNRARKDCQSADPFAYRDGRANRRIYAHRGAFGNEPKVAVFNSCVKGTTGKARSGKDRAEYDDGADYDQ